MVYQLIKCKTRVELEAGGLDNLEPIDGDLSKIEIADMTPDSGRGIRLGQFDSGRLIKTDHVPSRLLRKTKHHSIPLSDYNSGFGKSAYVSGAFKALLEDMEPGVHQFFEMSVMAHNKGIGSLFLFIVGQRIDGLDHAVSVPPIEPGQRLYSPTHGPTDKRVFSASKIGSAHVWAEKHELGLWMSNAFHDAVLAKGLSGIKDSKRYDESP